MKKFSIFLGMLLFLTGAFLVGCNKKAEETKTIETIKNLYTAYNGESTAKTKYAAYAEKAKTDGLDKIALLFSAVSQAEVIHSDNHKKALEKLGETVGEPQIGEFTVGTTEENLQDAIKGETYEVETMYPEFLKKAQEESQTVAITSMAWALETEKKHQVLYQSALKALQDKKLDALPEKYSICPKCGNTFDPNQFKEEDPCSFCMTSAEKYLKFPVESGK